MLVEVGPILGYPLIHVPFLMASILVLTRSLTMYKILLIEKVTFNPVNPTVIPSIQCHQRHHHLYPVGWQI